MYINKIITNKYNNNIISIYKMKYINIISIYKTKCTRTCICFIITF